MKDLPDTDPTPADFSPEIVLPGQIRTGVRTDSEASGEKSLMLAVLEDGIRCFQKHRIDRVRHDQTQLANEARKWILTEDWDHLFSFNNICEALSIDPSALRSALLEWHLKQQSEELQAEPMPASQKVYRLHLRTRRAGKKIKEVRNLH